MTRAFKKRPWLPEDDEQLRALIKAGSSIFLVAAKLKRTVQATRGHASKIGLSVKLEKRGLKSTK